jgi:hypothetical protein
MCGGLINNLMRSKREERTLPRLWIQLQTDSPKNDELIGQFLAKSAIAMDSERLHAGNGAARLLHICSLP